MPSAGRHSFMSNMQRSLMTAATLIRDHIGFRPSTDSEDNALKASNAAAYNSKISFFDIGKLYCRDNYRYDLITCVDREV